MKESFGDSFAGVAIAMLLCVLLFMGEPDIFDAIRVIFLNWAGIK